ncbi:hypothetical protein Pori4_00079 [Pseudomonas phage vB_PpuM-Pori-4]
MLEVLMWVVGIVASVCAFPFVFIWTHDLLVKPTTNNRTIDGGHSCPYANMTDEELYDFEADSFHGIKPENRTWPTLAAFLMYQDRKSASKELAVATEPLEGELLYPEMEVRENTAVIANDAWLATKGIYRGRDPKWPH